MNIAIVDDISLEIDRLTTMIEKFMEENHHSVKISSFNSAEEFLADYRPLKYTLIFMDIYMDQMSGMVKSFFVCKLPLGAKRRYAANSFSCSSAISLS